MFNLIWTAVWVLVPVVMLCGLLVGILTGILGVLRAARFLRRPLTTPEQTRSPASAERPPWTPTVVAPRPLPSDNPATPPAVPVAPAPGIPGAP